MPAEDQPAAGSSDVYKFEAVTGFFQQAEAGVKPEDFDNLKSNFGLIERRYDTDDDHDKLSTQWQRFEKYVRHLVNSAPDGTKFKVIYLGRHGEGYHNVAEAKYGTQKWDEYWSKLDGDDEMYWVDAHLTSEGKKQALNANKFFSRQFAKETGMPTPQGYYVSPLYRCLQTAYHTFSGLELPKENPFLPLIKENIREVLGEHTCDRRSTKTVIHEAFPQWRIEDNFAEQDELWQADHRETVDEHAKRIQEALDDIFKNDTGTFLSLTIHSGTIASILRVIGHREYRLPTGGLMPIFLKATKLST